MLKRLFQFLLFILVAFVAYLYYIYEPTNADAMIEHLERQLGQMDVQERVVDSLEQAIKHLEASDAWKNRAIRLAALREEIGTLSNNIEYNQKVRQLRQLTGEEAARFDSININPLRQQLLPLRHELETFDNSNRAQLQSDLTDANTVRLKIIDSISILVFEYSFYFYDGFDELNKVTLKDQRDKYGRQVKQQNQLTVLANLLFDQSKPTESQRQTFTEFSRFWCGQSPEKPDWVCDYPWINN